jgi:hypothetical protein
MQRSIVNNNDLHCCFLLHCGKFPENRGRKRASIVLRSGIGRDGTMQNNVGEIA